MELNFTEIDNLGNNFDNFDTKKYESINDLDSKKYWENVKKVDKPKKRVTFDDILSNMNLVVNQKGVLQYMAPIMSEQNYYSNDHPQPYLQNNANNNESLDPNLKHSYIFNKYFKDYRDLNAVPNVPAPRVPQTLEEYKQMLLEDRIKAIQQKNRIAQIKSTKMLYTNNVTNIGQNNVNQTVNLKASKNNLRRMSFT
jgi:hypothetical protein